MKAAIYNTDGTPRALVTGSLEAIVRTAEGYDLPWREVSADVERPEDAPPLED